MNILVTGASGFLGRYTVAELLRRGHQVRALSRSPLSWQHPALTQVQADLNQSDLSALTSGLTGIDAVVHLAAAKTGNFQAQVASTVTATERLLQAMQAAGITRLVAISSFSVYDYLAIAPNSLLDENSPIDPNPSQRDTYAQVKLLQEGVVRQFGQRGDVTILRPGIIYGKEALWNASLGAKASRIWLQINSGAELPLTYVENCASAIAAAVDCEAAIGQTLNIVDDDLPTQSAYLAQVLSRLADCSHSDSLRLVSLPWSLIQPLSKLAWQMNKLFAGKLKLPGLLVPARLQARFKPLHYSNQQAKQILGWTPQYALSAALNRSCGKADLLDILHS
jgi:2-alkyl-3-oxoalkanoate reductase